jgi:hypothetical protein
MLGKEGTENPKKLLFFFMDDDNDSLIIIATVLLSFLWLKEVKDHLADENSRV